MKAKSRDDFVAPGKCCFAKRRLNEVNDVTRQGLEGDPMLRDEGLELRRGRKRHNESGFLQTERERNVRLYIAPRPQRLYGDPHRPRRFPKEG